MTKLHRLHDAGQSVWYDFIRRDMLTGPGLRDLVEEGITGVTSNPSIFEQAIARTDLYDDQIATSAAETPQRLFEELAIVDIRAAADTLASVYASSGGDDGYVSLEVSPLLAADSAATISEAMRLWDEVDRPNLMVKVPATDAGIPAIEELTAAGLNINATLMFSLEHYEAVATAYVRGLRRSSNPAGVASVASFFVSRVDTATDAALSAIGTTHATEMRGQAAIANAKLAYRRYREIFEAGTFADLRAAGARPQRVLWASTSTKNPDYNDVMYVEELIGPNTVNTAPPATIEAFLDHGTVEEGTLVSTVEDAKRFIESLSEAGVDFDAVTRQLQTEGVQAFADAYANLLVAIDDKRKRLTS